MYSKKISNNTQLNPGDRIKVVINKRFSLGNTLDAYIMAGKVAAAENNKRWDVLSYEYTDDGVVLDIMVNNNVVVQQAGVVTPAVIITSVVGLSLIVLSVSTYLIVDDITDVAETPAAQVALASTPVIALAILAIVAYLYLKK